MKVVPVGIRIISSLLFTTTLFFSQIATSDDNKMQIRIIGGETAKTGAYSFMTALVYKHDTLYEGQFCGATYLGGGYVLTAAHCVEQETTNTFRVWIGGNNLNDSRQGVYVDVAEIYPHEEYDPDTTNNDIAILKLAEKVDDITPIKLITAEMAETLTTGDLLTVIGWGATNWDDVDEEADDYASELQEVEVPLYDQSSCADLYGQSAITDAMFCAGYPQGGKDSCSGDSGGPIMVEQNGEWNQVGIVSFGDGCALADAPGVYSRISAQLDWLKSKRSGIAYPYSLPLGFLTPETSVTKTITFSNSDTETFQIATIKANNINNISDISLTHDSCQERALNLGDSCYITLTITTDLEGDASFNLIIETDHSEYPELIIAVSAKAKIQSDNDNKSGSFGVITLLLLAGTLLLKHTQSRTNQIHQGKRSVPHRKKRGHSSALLLSASLLAGCSSADSENAATPQTINKPAIAEIYGATVKQSTIEFQVKSTGCTKVRDFQLSAKPMTETLTEITLLRLKPDLCRAAPKIITISIAKSDALSDAIRLQIQNPFLKSGNLKQ